MLLEFMVWGSREWYEQVIPLLKSSGFDERPDLRWADPESDGELMGIYYEYTAGTPLPVGAFQQVVSDINGILEKAEAPLQSLSIVADKGPVTK